MRVLISGFARISQITLPSASYSSRIGDATYEFVIKQLRSRARKVRFLARTVLFVIFAVLIYGFFLFARAETGVRQATSERIRDLFQEVGTVETNVNRLNIDKIEHQSVLDSFRKGEKPQGNEESWPDTFALKDELSRIPGQILSLENQRIVLNKEIEFEETLQQDTTTFIVSTLSTKVGSVLMLLFLVQILVSLYRYSMRLAAFYDSRADFLQVLDSEQKLTAATLADLLSSDKLEFSKTPSSPTEHAIQLAKEIAKVGRT